MANTLELGTRIEAATEAAGMQRAANAIRAALGLATVIVPGANSSVDGQRQQLTALLRLTAPSKVKTSAGAHNNDWATDFRVIAGNYEKSPIVK